MKKSGADILIECLLRENVEHIFGIPGGVVLKIFDVLYDAPIKHILTRHEQGAIHAADGYARATGRPGVCLVTSGPGATNTVTGIATAYMDSVPVIILTGQVPTSFIGNDAFQEADIIGITRPCTKHSYLVRDVRELARTVKEAFYIATTGCPGPVLVDLPKDVVSAETDFKYPDKVAIKGYSPTYVGHPKQIKKAAEIIAKAKKPVIYSGGGTISSGAHKQLSQLAEITSAPVTTTLMGLGGFPGNHPNFIGMLGMHGTYCANMAMCEADLIIAVGARFDDRITGKLDEFAVSTQIIHIDIDPASISKNVPVDVPIVGDLKIVLNELIRVLKASDSEIASSRRQWLERIEQWRSKHPLTYKLNDKIKPQFVVEQIYDLTQGDAIISTEVGQNQMWAAQYYKFIKPRSLLTSGGLGTMGYGFPAAIGAQVALPDKLVIDIAGDGSFQMNIQELATAVQYNLPVKVAILNNQCLGMIRQWQELFFKKRYSGSSLEVSPDYVKLAESYGAVGLRAERPEEVRPVLEKAFSISKPVVMDFRVDPEENVYPMVPAGDPIKNMLLA